MIRSTDKHPRVSAEMPIDQNAKALARTVSKAARFLS